MRAVKAVRLADMVRSVARPRRRVNPLGRRRSGRCRMRPRTCESRLSRGTRLGRAWDLVYRAHSGHVCGKVRSFQRPHRGRHVCECGVKWG